MRRFFGPLLIAVQALAWIVLDQWSKWWAESELEFREYVPLWGDLFGFRLVYNPGAAFGIAADYTWVLAIVAALAVAGLVWFSLSTRHWLWAIGLGAMTGGAISHLGDRLFREPGFAIGHIVDFLDYAGFFVGNVADIALVGGAIVLVLASVIGAPREGHAALAAAQSSAAEETSADSEDASNDKGLEGHTLIGRDPSAGDKPDRPEN
ncbi:MAG: signal peptidase II [Pontimonas sp.]